MSHRAVASKRALLAFAGAVALLINPAASHADPFEPFNYYNQGTSGCALRTVGSTTSPQQDGYVWSETNHADFWIYLDHVENRVKSVSVTCTLRDNSPTGPVLYSKTETDTVTAHETFAILVDPNVSYEVDPAHDVYISVLQTWTDSQNTVHTVADYDTQAIRTVVGDVLVRHSPCAPCEL